MLQFDFQRHFPREVMYYRKRGFCYQKMQNLEPAIADFKKLVQMKPSIVIYHTDLIDALTEAGRYKEARKGGFLLIQHYYFVSRYK